MMMCLVSILVYGTATSVTLQPINVSDAIPDEYSATIRWDATWGAWNITDDNVSSYGVILDTNLSAVEYNVNYSKPVTLTGQLDTLVTMESVINLTYNTTGGVVSNGTAVSSYPQCWDASPSEVMTRVRSN